MANNKKALLWGGAFGLLAPFAGMYIGLQVSIIVGNILMFPIVGMSAVLNSPFGMWSPLLMVLGLVLSIVVWAIIFVIISKVFSRN